MNIPFEIAEIIINYVLDHEEDINYSFTDFGDLKKVLDWGKPIQISWGNPEG